MKTLSSRNEDKIKIQKIKMAEEHSTNMPSNPTTSSEYKKILIRLKEEFEQRFNTPEVSYSSEKLKEYKFLAILGQGAFGLVVIYHSSFSLLCLDFWSLFTFLSIQKLVKHETTEKFYAVKIIAKEKVVKKKNVNHTLNEKQILRAIKFPFVVCLAFSMKDNSYLYFGMPFINGGEMFTHLRKYEDVCHLSALTAKNLL